MNAKASFSSASVPFLFGICFYELSRMFIRQRKPALFLLPQPGR